MADAEQNELQKLRSILQYFLKGVDLSNNQFIGNELPELFTKLSTLSWITLKNTNITNFPEVLTNLTNLQQISLIKSNINSIPLEISNIEQLKNLVLRNNQLQSIPPSAFSSRNLETVDLSKNLFRDSPINLEEAKKCLVLNLSNNSLTEIPSSVFVELTNLHYLNLANNKLETVPPQLRRLINLRVLILNDNTLKHAQLRQVTSLVNLTTLHLRNTERDMKNFPSGLDNLKNLKDIDLSMNELTSIPESLYHVEGLKKLNLSDNKISDLSSLIDNWEYLEVLNLSRNRLSQLPNAFCKLLRLRQLYINENDLTFETLPPGIGKLSELEIFSAAANRLTTIPESLCRCGKLKKIILNSNNLVTFPDSYHYLTELEELDVRNNPDLQLPPKPLELIKSQRINDVYNVDFSLSTHLEKVGKTVPLESQKKKKKTDTVARKLRLGQRKRIDSRSDDGKSDVVLSGMRKLAGKRLPKDDEEESEVKPKKWDELIVKPKLNFDEIFHEEDEIGQFPGLTMWEIDNFLPRLLEKPTNVFYNEDCYIILDTYIDEHKNLNWKIWHWIGSKATLDKKAASAIHSVNLRDYLDAKCMCRRQEENDEDEDFLSLFDECHIEYVDGARAESGFYVHDEGDVPTRMICVRPKHPPYSVSPLAESLNSHLCYIITTKSIIWVWNGIDSKLNLKSKARLIAEKINKVEYKAEAEIRNIHQETETEEFWDIIGGEGESSYDPNIIDLTFNPILYRVDIRKGSKFILSQIELRTKILSKDLLTSDGVYILDTHHDVFIWFGKKTNKMIRNISSMIVKLLLWTMVDRSRGADFLIYTENMESVLFKLQFKGWDDVIHVDFTRTSESVARRGLDLKAIVEKDKMKADLNALLSPIQERLDDHDAEQIISDYGATTYIKQALVLENSGRKKIALPKEEYGHFYSANTYVFFIEEQEDEDIEDEDDESEPASFVTMYCWQGRDAPAVELSTFKLELDLKLSRMNIDMVIQSQQQEDPSFLMAFQNKFVIHRGRRPLKDTGEARLYELRSTASIICSRMIELPKLDANCLNSQLSFVLVVPFESGGGVVYAWIGSKTSNSDSHNCIEIGNKMLTPSDYSFQVVNEGNEPDLFFWEGIGGKRPYDLSADFLQVARLFRCSNDKGKRI